MHIPAKLYRQILKVMPIPCVDLLVTDRQGRVLLVKRKNEPVKGQWWFPGGRVHHGETRAQAARRKLREECGLTARDVREIGTYDVVLPRGGSRPPCHGITTLFDVKVARHGRIRLDDQSAGAAWRLPRQWQRDRIHSFLMDSLKHISRRSGRA